MQPDNKTEPESPQSHNWPWDEQRFAPPQAITDAADFSHAVHAQSKEGTTAPELTLEEVAGLQFHPLADLFPLMNDSDLEDLARDIEVNGLREPIVLLKHDGVWKILDGRNRFRGARKYRGLGTAGNPNWRPFVAFDPHSNAFSIRPGLSTEAAALAYVMSKNFVRRHLTDDQKAVLGNEYYKQLPKRPHGGNRKSKSQACDLDLPTADQAKEEAAVKAGTSVKQMERAGAVAKKSPEKYKEVHAGTKTIAAAEAELKSARKSIQADRDVSTTPATNVADDTPVQTDSIYGGDLSIAMRLDLVAGAIEGIAGELALLASQLEAVPLSEVMRAEMAASLIRKGNTLRGMPRELWDYATLCGEEEAAE